MTETLESIMSKLQYTTRKRFHKEPELPYSDYYDEFIGRNRTGRIVDLKGNVIFDENKKSDSITENKTVEYIPVTMYSIIVDHHYKVECVGTFNEDDFMSIDLVKYEQELKSKFGSSFINSVYVEKNTV